MLAAGLDVGGSEASAWVADLGRPGQPAAVAARGLAVLRRSPERAELDPRALESACRDALQEAVARTGRPDRDFLGVTVSSARAGFVLLDAAGEPLGDVVLDADRRGAGFLPALADTHALTGHRPAPELTLPKLLAVRAEEPERWAATRRVLFVHDWLVWRLSGVQATEISFACGGGMADVAARTWAGSLLDELGIGTGRLAPVVEPGTAVGELAPGWPLPAALPVVTGCGDVQLAALGAGGLGEGVVTVVGGTSPLVAVASACAPRDPLAQTRLSTHALPGTWMAELGLRSGPAGPREAHAFALRSQLEVLERVLGRSASAVVLAGAPPSGGPAELLAAVLGRDVHVHTGPRASRGGSHLVARAVGAHTHAPGLPAVTSPAADRSAWETAYSAWMRSAAPGGT